jgi:transmembrane sensor
LIREAIGWIVKLKSGEATVGDAAAFAAWRLENSANEQAYRTAARLWRALHPASIASIRSDPPRSDEHDRASIQALPEGPTTA